MRLNEYFNFYFYISKIYNKSDEYILYCRNGEYDIGGLKENEVIILSEKDEFGLNVINTFKTKKLKTICISIEPASSQLIEDTILRIEFEFDGDIHDKDRLYEFKLDTRRYTENSIIKKLFLLLKLFPPKPDMFLVLEAKNQC